MGNLVAREKSPHLDARGVPARTEHRHLRLGRFRRNTLESRDAFARERADLHCDFRRRSRDCVILSRFHSHDARGFGRSIAPGKVVPKAKDTSPNMVPGRRQPSLRSIPSNNFTTSIFPDKTAKSARSPPSGTANSPTPRCRSADVRTRRSISASASAENDGIARTSSVVNMIRGVSRSARFSVCQLPAAEIPSGQRSLGGARCRRARG